MSWRLSLCRFAVLLTTGCASTSNPPPANDSSAALREPNNPADMRASAAYGGPFPVGQGPDLIGPGLR